VEAEAAAEAGAAAFEEPNKASTAAPKNEDIFTAAGAVEQLVGIGVGAGSSGFTLSWNPSSFVYPHHVVGETVVTDAWQKRRSVACWGLCFNMQYSRSSYKFRTGFSHSLDTSIDFQHIRNKDSSILAIRRKVIITALELFAIVLLIDAVSFSLPCSPRLLIAVQFVPCRGKKVCSKANFRVSCFASSSHGHERS
jgi:hypothetical protein